MAHQEDLWTYLKNLGTRLGIAWLLVGDVNQVIHLDEKGGGAGARLQPTKRLGKALDVCDMMNLGFSGPKHTWSFSEDSLNPGTYRPGMV